VKSVMEAGGFSTNIALLAREGVRGEKHNVFDGSHRLGAADVFISAIAERTALQTAGQAVPEELQVKAEIGVTILNKGLACVLLG